MRERASKLKENSFLAISKVYHIDAHPVSGAFISGLCVFMTGWRFAHSTIVSKVSPGLERQHWVYLYRPISDFFVQRGLRQQIEHVAGHVTVRKKRIESRRHHKNARKRPTDGRRLEAKVCGDVSPDGNKTEPRRQRTERNGMEWHYWHARMQSEVRSTREHIEWHSRPTDRAVDTYEYIHGTDCASSPFN